MPTVRKLSLDEVQGIEKRNKGQRKLIEEEYDNFLNDYVEGEYGEAELEDSENRITVRNRLKAAASRRNLALDFKRTKGNILRFKVSRPEDVDSSAADEDEEELVPVAETPQPEPRARGRGKKKSNGVA